MRMKSLSSAGLAFFLMCGTLWSQQGGGQGGGGGTGGGATTGGTGGTTGGTGTGSIGTRPGTGTRMPGQDTQMPTFEMQRPIYFSGKVVMEDGTPPGDQAVIEMVCSGQPRPQAYTDTKGRFSFQLGQNQGMFSDASYGSLDSFPGANMPGTGNSNTRGGVPGQRGYSERDLIGCELRASLAGFRSDAVQLSGRRLLDNPDLGTIVLRRLANVDGYTFSLTTAMAPKDAKKAYEKGLDLNKKKKVPEAQEQFKKAVEVYPKYAIAWYELGRTQEQQEQLEDARKSYDEAVKADGKFVSPYLQLAGLDLRAGKWEDLAQTTDKAIRLNPYFPHIYLYNAVAKYNLQQLDAAEKSAREAVKLDTAHRMPKSNQILGLILAQKHDYQGAVEQLKGYLTASPMAADAENVRKQISDIERIASTAQPASAVAPVPPNQND